MFVFCKEHFYKNYCHNLPQIHSITKYNIGSLIDNKSILSKKLDLEVDN